MRPGGKAGPRLTPGRAPLSFTSLSLHFLPYKMGINRAPRKGCYEKLNRPSGLGTERSGWLQSSRIRVTELTLKWTDLMINPTGSSNSASPPTWTTARSRVAQDRGAETCRRGKQRRVPLPLSSPLLPPQEVCLPLAPHIYMFFPLIKSRIRLMESRQKAHVALGIRQTWVF